MKKCFKHVLDSDIYAKNTEMKIKIVLNSIPGMEKTIYKHNNSITNKQPSIDILNIFCS